eukprot:SM000025S08410  [mRNA]  locus=s25:673665:674689:+ [translate_table: standard]
MSYLLNQRSLRSWAALLTAERSATFTQRRSTDRHARRPCGWPRPQKFHVLRGALPPQALVLAEASACSALLATALSFVLPSERARRRLLGAALAASLGLAMFWAFHLTRLPPAATRRLLWVPAGPLGYVALCAFVDRTVRQMQREVEALRNAMYNFKTA